MPRMSRSAPREPGPRQRPGMTPDEREAELVAAAVELAHKQILEGTASSQVLTHFLQLGSEKEKLQRERLKLENKLIEAKTEAIEAQKDVKELYLRAMRAMVTYSGGTPLPEELEGEEVYDDAP